MSRDYKRYDQLEEVKFGMWDDTVNKKEQINKCVKFMMDVPLFGEYMMKVVKDWQFSCANSLTDESLNHKAWIGQAACAYSIGVPNDIVRISWGLMNSEKQKLSNSFAERAIKYWKQNNQRKSEPLYTNVERQMLLFRYTRSS